MAAPSSSGRDERALYADEHSHGPPRWATVATFSAGVARLPSASALFGARTLLLRPRAEQARDIDAVIGWGEKANTAAARRYAAKHSLPYWRAEDGFLRSLGLGVEGDPPLSVVLDDCGIYYDARTASRLERWLDQPQGALDPLADAALLERARVSMARIAESKLSKYNHSSPRPLDLGDRARQRVLVVDQTEGDLSIACGLGAASSFTAMLSAALCEHPDAEILVKTHPDVVAGKKRGYLQGVAGDQRIRVVAEAVNPMALLADVHHVYVVTSQLGFEALLMGKPVTCFGVPFYAGWGLTDDRAPVPRRRRARTLEQVFAAAYILYPRYVDPDTGEPCELERVIDHLALQRRLFADNCGTVFCLGIRFWKRNYVRRYLRSPGSDVRFVRSAEQAERLGFGADSKLLVWGQLEREAVRRLTTTHAVQPWCMEDGFLRSVGLGSDLVTPASLVVDRVGIYYDPSAPSELEQILQSADFSAAELRRAAALRQQVVSAQISKYNVGAPTAIRVPSSRLVLLVPGQVEDDASIRLGCPSITTNLGLLRAAREQRPDAFIIYKPHPDVLSGNRVGAVPPQEAAALCDLIETGASLPQCLSVADEVHTLTSLVGFEALLRDKQVVVYGQPFYCSWGLTCDRYPVARRSRTLTIDELVAGTLVRYPRYLNRESGCFTSPEVIVRQLCEERDERPSGEPIVVSWPRRQLRKLRHAYKELTRVS